MLKNVILRQKREKESFVISKYVERNQSSYARRWIDSQLIKVVIGPRRAGKSVFSFMLLDGRQFMYLNLDDEFLGANAGTITTDEIIKELHSAYGNVKTVLFDEIQNLPNWELFVNRLHREGYNLILTGSNARLLSKELSTALTGRHIPIEIYPFDFKEFLDARRFKFDLQYIEVSSVRGELLRLMEEFMLSGGFPEVVVNNLDSRDYLRVLYDSLLFKDVVKRHKVKQSSQIENVGTYLINNFASFYSLRKLQNALDLKSVTTVEKYTKYLEEAYLVFSLLRYSPESVKRIKSPKKVYVIDNGFISAKAIQHSPDRGRMMENLLFVELIKHGFQPNSEIFYYKTRNDREIDFVLKKGTEIVELIQVCYESSSSEVEKREVKALTEAGEELKTDNLTLLTWDEKRVIKQNGFTINIIPLIEWLMK